MNNKKIIEYINQYSDELKIVNKLIVAAYLEFNNIKVTNNELILSYLHGNDVKKIKSFNELIQEYNNKFDFEDLIQLFEITIPKNDIVVNGAVYTPKYIKDYIVKDSLNTITTNKIDKLKCADISCGTGAFLYTISEQIHKQINKQYSDIFKENIFGLDISDYSIERTKILLSLLAISNGEDMISFDFNLSVGNALSFDWNKNYLRFDGFDIIVGNPPYVRAKNLDIKTKALMSNWNTTKSGNQDLYIPFFEIAIKYLKENGILGYITVNTFKRSVNARKLREYFKSNSLNISIYDFGNQQIFRDKSTYTCLIFIEKNKNEEVKYIKIKPKDIEKNNKIKFLKINYDNLNTHKGWILDNNKTLENIKKIENIGTPLGDMYPIKNGLATLSNSIFIFKPINEDDKYYYLNCKKTYKIEKEICRDIIKPNRLKYEKNILEMTEKIIYPYNKNEENTPKIIDEEYFKINYPNTYEYLESHKLQLLNRDKGKEKKYLWYEFGRSQSLNDHNKKLLFPYMSNQPYFVYTNNEDLLFYAGYAIFSSSTKELKILRKILNSKLFWYYITKTSKPYSGDYYALSKNYVKDFSICKLTKTEEDFLIKTKQQSNIDSFLFKKYNINEKDI